MFGRDAMMKELIKEKASTKLQAIGRIVSGQKRETYHI